MKKLFTFIYAISSIILLFSFNIESMVLSTMSTLVLNNKIASYMTKAVEDAYPIIEKESIQVINEKINDSDYLNVITDKYFNSVIYDILNDKVTAPDISSEVDKIVDENFANYEYQYAVKKALKNIDYNTVYANVLQYAKDIMSDDLLYLIHAYLLINNIYTKIICSILIVLNLSLLYIFSKPKTDILKYLYIGLSVSGIIQILMLLALKNITMYSDITSIVVISVAELAIGALLDTIYNKIEDKRYAKIEEEEDNEEEIEED